VSIVLLPGLDGTGELLEPLARALGERASIVRSLVLVAGSFSGPLAVRIAATAPPGSLGLAFLASTRRDLLLDRVDPRAELVHLGLDPSIARGEDREVANHEALLLRELEQRRLDRTDAGVRLVDARSEAGPELVDASAEMVDARTDVGARGHELVADLLQDLDG
jgi:hypothetical protein